MRPKRSALPCTNCATTPCKHGALSNGDGDVSLVWRIDDSGAEPNFEMTWRERGGPRVNASGPPGSAAVVLERLTAAGLNASSTLSFEADGVTWRLIAPLKDVVKTSDSALRRRRTKSLPADETRSDWSRFLRLSAGRFVVWNEAGVLARSAGRPGDLPMPEKTPERPRKRKTKASCAQRSIAGAPMADRYIADQLKAIYEAVVAEPVPDRLLQLLDRLDSDEEK